MQRFVASLIVIAACQAPQQGWMAPQPLSAPALADSIWVCDQHAGRATDLDAMLDDLARNEVVFFGETHLDETTHRLELAVYEGLIERTGGRVVLALEMFERDVQPVLDDYLAGRIAEGDFLKRARAWHNYRNDYRPLIELAKRRNLPVVASNAPASLRRKVGRGGPEALDALPSQERALLPATLHPNTEAYWRRFARVVRGHMGMIAGTTPERRLTSGQSLWDNSMGDSCAKALDRHPGSVVLHINGSFHSRDRGGAVHQLLARRPGTRVGLLEAVPVSDFHSFDPFGSPERADYLVFVKNRARSNQQGFFSVKVAQELRFKLHMPHGASDEEPLPLVVWLGDDGFRAADALATWAVALGQEAAVAAVEPPYPLLGDDLTAGGRWFWQETFSADLGALQSGLVELVGYLLRNHPVDRRRVLLAGEGTGATVVAATSLHAAELALPALAVAPRRFGKLRSLALPAPRKAGGRRLHLLALEKDAASWKQEAQDYRKSGLPVRLGKAPANGWARFGAAEKLVRKRLGLRPRKLQGETKTLLVLERDTLRARFWAQLYALRLKGKVAIVNGDELPADAGDWQQKPLAFAEGGFSPSDLMDGVGLPMAPGPFGGTTILIVPDDVDDAPWQELVKQGAIKKRSRFAHLVVVRKQGLAGALEQVKAKGRRSVLVVPAVFCTDAATMRGYSAEAEPYQDLLDIAWLPGLGVRLYRYGK